MVIQTTKEINGVVYDRTYSDKGMMVERGGSRYSEAIDPLGSGRTYTETDERIDRDDDPNEATEADYQNALRDMGVDV